MVDIDTDEITIGAVADFDYDAPTQIRWRGLGHGRGLGACCYIDPADPDLATTICADGMSRGACTALDGDFAPSKSCLDDPCPGACCEDDGAGNFICEDLNQSDCDDVGGVFKGVNTACDDDPDPCIIGACCQSTGCTDETEGDCNDLGGTWVLDSFCTDDPDPCAGACCILDLTTPCQDLNEPDCDLEDGGFQGIDTVCPDDACIVGACCFTDSPCEIETATGCSDLGGEFQGSGVDCTPDPCGATGACCQGSDVCSEETEDDCVDLIGGTYQGDDVPCDPNPCTCPAITMTCDSISAAKSKCGFSEFIVSTPPKLYLRFDQSHVESDNGPSCRESGATCVLKSESSYDYFEQYDAATCVHTTDTSGRFRFNTDCGGNVTSSGPFGKVKFSAIPSSSTTAELTTTSVVNSNPECLPFPQTITEITSQTLSVEYTTSLLISTTVGSLPPYSGVYTGGACAAARFLSSDEATYSIQRSKPKFSFPSSSMTFILSYDEVFTPAGGGSPSTVSRSFSIGAGQTEFFGPEIFEPSTNGTTSIVNIQCTSL